MNASRISTDLANCVKTTKVQENGRQAYAIRRPVNVTKRPVNAIKVPINAIQRPVNSTLRPVNSTLIPVNAIQSLDERESSPDQLMPQDTAITSCNKPGVKRFFYLCFFFHSICSSCPCTCREKICFFVTFSSFVNLFKPLTMSCEEHTDFWRILERAILNRFPFNNA